MKPFLIYSAFKDPKEQSDIRPDVHNQPLHDVNEGSEFLDDAIRMEDVSLPFTEESISTESHENLL
jgi:hypothetical protein